MEIEKSLEKLEEKISKNLNKIQSNTEKIHQNTGALEILKTFKADSNKFFIMWLITFTAFLMLLGYTIYLTNDISTVTTQEVEQEASDGSNYFVGRDGDINDETNRQNDN